MPRALPLVLAIPLLVSAAAGRHPEPFPEYLPVVGWPKLPPGLKLGPVSAVATDAADRVYVAHRGPRPVLVFDRDGTFLRSWGDDHFHTPHGLRVDPAGNVWVTDIGHHLVMKFDPAGKLMLTLGRKGRAGAGVGEFDRPTDVAVAPGGEFYVTDGYGNARVLKYDPTGKLLKEWGTKGKGEGEFNLPHSVCLDTKGRVYVGDRENNRVQVFDADGRFIEQWKESGAPYGLFRAGDRLFVADGRANWVRVLGPDGKPLGRIGEKGTGAGQLLMPHMLCVDSRGDVYVAEVTNKRVQKYTARPADPPGGLLADDANRIDRGLALLTERLAALKRERAAPPASEREDLVADIEVFRKAVAWALRYETKLEPADVALVLKGLARGTERAAALAAGGAPWAARKGKGVRGYVSAVDGSVQPFGLVVPAGYDPAKPARLDVVLHGSTKPVGLSELRFMARFDEGDGQAPNPPAANFLELHPLGRVENCYRWAGETDVFEAIAAVCRRYAIDRDRVVLRGMSMGASGTWHLGLKHPDRFVALGPYCGYVDTHEFSHTPLPNFVKVGPLPAHQERGLHLLDAVGYAANAGVVPAVACMGEKDVFFQAHVLMGRAMEREGLKLVNLISPGTGHVIDPVTHAEQMRRIAAFAERGVNRAPRRLRFVTQSLRYGECHWLRVLGLGEHYARAELDATVADDGTVELKEPTNVTRFALLPPVLQEANPKLRVGGTAVALPARDRAAPPARPVIGRWDGKWAYLGEFGAVALDGKRPGLQGPIDDAFTTPFLCVRGTGKGWNPAVRAWADASLARFAAEWHRYFRGELPVKDDRAVTAEDMTRCNLILFGDPGSNTVIPRVLPGLPVTWTEKHLTVGKETFAAADHAPVLIHPNPLAPGRYVVLNSGHTFREKELASLNYLLFPRLGDWAVVKVGTSPSVAPAEEVMRTGFFDERWLLP